MNCDAMVMTNSFPAVRPHICASRGLAEIRAAFVGTLTPEPVARLHTGREPGCVVWAVNFRSRPLRMYYALE